MWESGLPFCFQFLKLNNQRNKNKASTDSTFVLKSEDFQQASLYLLHMNTELQYYRKHLHSSVQEIDTIFEDCLSEAKVVMTQQGIHAWLAGATKVGALGRGTELILIVLKIMPQVVHSSKDEKLITEITDQAAYLSRSAVGLSIKPFLSTLPAIAVRLKNAESLREWLEVVTKMADQAKEGLPHLLEHVVFLLNQLHLEGLKRWIHYGIRTYKDQPHRFPDFFSLQTSDARAMLQRERNGTLYMDYERQLKLYLRSFWELEEDFKPYSLAFDIARKPVPHLDKLGFHIPDVYEAVQGIHGKSVSGINRYRAMIAHMAAHRIWSKPYLADNYSPFQHIVIEVFEDARVETLALRHYPGLRKLWMSLHPIPEAGSCPKGWSPIRLHTTMLSRALLDPDHPYTDPKLLKYVARFHEKMEESPYDPELSAKLGVSYLLAIQTVEFRLSKIWFEDTIVDYRDDNRYLWMFLESVDSTDDFHSDHGTSMQESEEESGETLPPQYYPEWDYTVQNYRPDWTTVYEGIQAEGDAAHIDELLAKHQLLAKRLRKIVDMLKPQQRKRVRYQEEGDELDVDILIQSMIDLRSGTIPETRFYQSHVRDGRDIAVLLLLDLSESINETPEGATSTILQLSQEAVSLMAYAVDSLGDPFAVAGFSSNTRHEVRYTHFKGFKEVWGEKPKARLASMEAGYSTRMGAALRHAGLYLEQCSQEKRLLLILTDGEPHDIDVQDARYLKEDTHTAVNELDAKGISSYCITLDPNADEYVSQTFGINRYTIIDKVQQLPEKLPQLFMNLTQ